MFQGIPQHLVQHSGEQPDQEKGVREEEWKQVEGFHQEELRAAHQFPESSSKYIKRSMMNINFWSIGLMEKWDSLCRLDGGLGISIIVLNFYRLFQRPSFI